MLPYIYTGGYTYMKEIVSKLKDLDIHELEKLISIAETTIKLKKQIADIEGGRFVTLQQGKKQPIVMLDANKEIIETFTGFNKCSKYLKEVLGVKNEQNKLRKALDDGSELAGYTFVLQTRGKALL